MATPTSNPSSARVSPARGRRRDGAGPAPHARGVAAAEHDVLQPAHVVRVVLQGLGAGLRRPVATLTKQVPRLFRGRCEDWPKLVKGPRQAARCSSRIPRARPTDCSVFRYTRKPQSRSPRISRGGFAAAGDAGEDRAVAGRLCSGKREPPRGKPAASNAHNRIRRLAPNGGFVGMGSSCLCVAIDGHTLQVRAILL